MSLKKCRAIATLLVRFGSSRRSLHCDVCAQVRRPSQQQQRIAPSRRRYAVVKEVAIAEDYTNSAEDVARCLRLYSAHGIDADFIADNLSLLEIKPDLVEKKLHLISTMQLKNNNHAVPFMSLSLKELMRLSNKVVKEASVIPHGNRMYYLSHKLQIDPQLMANCIIKRLFLYNVPFENVQNVLSILLDMGVDPKNIVKDLWVFRYSPKIVEERMEKLHLAGKEKLMPWMVKCQERVLERTIKITTTTKKLLGENKSVTKYLAERLKCSEDMVYVMAMKIPAISTIRVTKVKNMLDFLFSEGYTESDIINTPRILAHSIHTIKQRLKHLRSLNCNSQNLNVFCKSKRDFEKYLLYIQGKDRESKRNQFNESFSLPENQKTQ